MYSNQSAVPMSKPRLSSSATGARQPFRMASYPRRSSPMAHVGRDVYDNLGACPRNASSSRVAADTQGGIARDVFPDPRPFTNRHPYDNMYLPAVSAHRPRTTPLPYEEAARVAWAQRYPDRGDHRGVYCQVGACQAAPSYSFDGARPAISCPYHRDEDMVRVRHDDATMEQEWCERTAGENDVFKEGKLAPLCSEHKMAGVVTAKPAHCEHAGCCKTPKYGPKDGPARFCQSHKRVGMYTNRNGNTLVATRDGNAFRLAAAPSAGGSTLPSDRPSEPSRSSQQATTYLERFVSLPLEEVLTPSASTERLTTLYRKLCEFSGCQVQPSYGLSGTTRPRFCAVHKTKEMVGLKNRPCLFPGCAIRPHYGLSRGRPVYCATHKKNSMVHLLKEAKKRETEHTTSEAQEDSANAAGVTPVARAKSHRGKAEGAKREEEEGGKEGLDGVVDKRQQQRGGRGVAKRSKRKLVVAGKGETYTKGDELGDSSSMTPPPSREVPSAPSSSSFRLAPLLQEEVTSATASTEAKKTSRQSSRVIDALEVTSSAEKSLLLQQARTTGRTEAEASGSGKRARAPSRRFLEAAGLAKNEGAQWMTKEIKQTEAKRMKDLREQRRQYKAAGLKSGEVLEACSVLVISAGDAINNNSGGRGGVGQDGAEELMRDKHNWQKITPAEILAQAGGRQSLAWAAALKAGKATASAQGRDTDTPTRNVNESKKKRKSVPSDTKCAAATNSRPADANNAKTPKRSRQRKDHDPVENRPGRMGESGRRTGWCEVGKDWRGETEKIWPLSLPRASSRAAVSRPLLGSTVPYATAKNTAYSACTRSPATAD